MHWRHLLRQELDYAYLVADKMMALVDDDALDWKPETGQNWMTVAQLLHHMTDACGFCFKGFVTGEWGIPPDLDENDMLPSADKMPAVDDVRQARDLLTKDKQLALDMLAKVTDHDLEGKMVSAPWNPTALPLGVQLKQMVDHLNSHRHQLFYYLKLQGKPVHTGTLWGGDL